MDANWLIKTITLAYFLGSIPFGLILTRLAGLGDVRKIGSGKARDRREANLIDG